MENYIPTCLRNLPKPPPGRKAVTNRRKQNREMAEQAILECIARIRGAERSAPKDWHRGYNSAVTKLELFLGEVREKQWTPAEL